MVRMRSRSQWSDRRSHKHKGLNYETDMKDSKIEIAGPVMRLLQQSIVIFAAVLSLLDVRLDLQEVL